MGMKILIEVLPKSTKMEEFCLCTSRTVTNKLGYYISLE